MYESSSAFALFWNMVRNQLPQEVNGDFEKWLHENQMVRMDTMGSQDVTKGVYSVKCRDDTFEFNGVDLPPPSGMFGVNYARCGRIWMDCMATEQFSGPYTGKVVAINMQSLGRPHVTQGSEQMGEAISLFANTVSRLRLLPTLSLFGYQLHGMELASRSTIQTTRKFFRQDLRSLPLCVLLHCGRMF